MTLRRIDDFLESLSDWQYESLKQLVKRPRGEVKLSDEEKKQGLTFMAARKPTGWLGLKLNLHVYIESVEPYDDNAHVRFYQTEDENGKKLPFTILTDKLPLPKPYLLDVLSYDENWRVSDKKTYASTTGIAKLDGWYLPFDHEKEDLFGYILNGYELGEFVGLLAEGDLMYMYTIDPLVFKHWDLSVRDLRILHDKMEPGSSMNVEACLHPCTVKCITVEDYLGQQLEIIPFRRLSF